MSKYNNVNPGQYKVAGRERQGEAIVHHIEKAHATRQQPDAPKASRKQPAPSAQRASRQAVREGEKEDEK